MSEETKAIQETAKAVQEAAKATPAVIKAGSDLARWGARVLGTMPEDLVGLAVGDYVHELRYRNLDRIGRRTNKILEDRKVKDSEPIGFKLARPAFEAASEESDERLQDLWANLFANAMDPDRDVSLRKAFIDTLRKFEPIDALVFDRVVTRPDGPAESADSISRVLNIRLQLARLSAKHLVDLGCIGTTNEPYTYRHTDLGFELWTACQPDGKD